MNFKLVTNPNIEALEKLISFPMNLNHLKSVNFHLDISDRKILEEIKNYLKNPN